MLESDLCEIHSSLRVTIDVNNILMAVEKYFGGTANYRKGKGAEYIFWMMRYHPTAYLYPVSRACGGARQDLGVEGSVAVIMNVPYYLEFLIWRMRCGHGNGILERNLYMLLRSVEMIAFLRVLSIMHISICMPLRWLAGHCGELSEYNFGVADMASVIDIMDAAFLQVLDDGEKMLDETFMMGIFDSLKEQIPPFRDYLTYIFEEKQGSLIGPHQLEDRILPWDQLRAELFYPTRVDIIETHDFCTELACEAASIFRREFRDERKATHKYLSEIHGERSMAEITDQERKDGLGMAAGNCISESGHAAATGDLKTF